MNFYFDGRGELASFHVPPRERLLQGESGTERGPVEKLGGRRKKVEIKFKFPVDGQMKAAKVFVPQQMRRSPNGETGVSECSSNFGTSSSSKRTQHCPGLERQPAVIAKRKRMQEADRGVRKAGDGVEFFSVCASPWSLEERN
ncbi:MAG: hypothetical protein QM796_06010 [Chthoniobacteraceae bacterium]